MGRRAAGAGLDLDCGWTFTGDADGHSEKAGNSDHHQIGTKVIDF